MKSHIQTLKLIKEFNRRTHAVLNDFADCSICGLCCIDLDVPVLPEEIKRIISHLDIDKKTFLKKFTKRDKKKKKKKKKSG